MDVQPRLPQADCGDANTINVTKVAIAGMSLMDGRLAVAVIDDDESVRESLPDLLREFGYTVRAFSSAEEFLASDCLEQVRGLILDVAMPGMSGPELQQELKRRRQDKPIVFITTKRDEGFRQRMLAQGAAACLFKPFSEADLLEALNATFRMG